MKFNPPQSNVQSTNIDRGEIIELLENTQNMVNLKNYNSHYDQ